MPGKPNNRGGKAITRRAAKDLLGLRSAMADWLLPSLVGAMSFLAALAIAGSIAAATLAQHWQSDAG